MLIDFFYTLRSAKLPVSVKEYLTLLEALKEGVVGPNSHVSGDDDTPDGYKIDDFYYLSRTTLVKDEKHYDKFDRAFASYFKGVRWWPISRKTFRWNGCAKTLNLNSAPKKRPR